ncbi:MAG: hypothetical protein RBR15_06250 [Sphaerochaeta sp.]|nr:hypothetical protein [Sphaerochaeta sp.]
MKKITVLLMILVLSTVTVFAGSAANGNSIGDKSTIDINTEVEKQSLFGVSADPLKPESFLSLEKFTDAVNESMGVDVKITDLKQKTLVGYVSGINNTSNKIILSVQIFPLTNQDNPNAAKIELSLLANGNSEDSLTIAPAEAVLGTLPSVELLVYGDPAAIDLAPAGRYTTHILFRVIAN